MERMEKKGRGTHRLRAEAGSEVPEGPNDAMLPPRAPAPGIRLDISLSLIKCQSPT